MGHMSEQSSQTPMMRQYYAAKAKVPDHLLMFRLGDFFEFFYDDAIAASKVLGITLTKRHESPMCGIPFHAAERYIRILLESGHKIALCDQVSKAKAGALVEREIVEILTPGSVTDYFYLSGGEPNYLCAVHKKGGSFFCAWMDPSVGDLYVCACGPDEPFFASLMSRIHPREVLLPDGPADNKNFHQNVHQDLHQNIHQQLRQNISEDACVTLRPEWHFSPSEGSRLLLEHSGAQSLSGFGIGESNRGVLAPVAALLEYLRENMPSRPLQVRSVQLHARGQYVELDANAIYNLELFATMRENDKKHSLCGTLDACRTAMGSRALQHALRFPRTDMQELIRRNDAVEFFVDSAHTLLASLRASLEYVSDLERLFTKIYLKKANPKDVYELGKGLRAAADSCRLVRSFVKEQKDTQKILPKIFPEILLERMRPESMEHIARLIETALCDPPPAQFGEAYAIRAGYNEELDALRNTQSRAQEVLAAHVEKLQVETNLQLKLKNNNIIGYFFEFPHSARNKLPQAFLLRQTLTGSDRYKTREITDIENDIARAQESVLEKEAEIFYGLCEGLSACAQDIREAAACIGSVDMLACFAHLAIERGYSRPVFSTKRIFTVQGGRHPVVERVIPQGSFVANDVALNADTSSFLMVTGPNMAGKSTFLRQNALIALMAHIGSFVPAEKVCCPIFDKIFCRAGASDNLIKGESTFLTEMSETAFILHNATERSLVIMDEIGRGTGVREGKAIAQAVAEFLLSRGIFTFFATHYHELAAIADARLTPCTVLVERQDEKIIFMHKIVFGAADTSYGTEVARRAGVPAAVLVRAEDLIREDEARVAARVSAGAAGGVSAGLQDSLGGGKTTATKMQQHDEPEALNDKLRAYREICAALEALSVEKTTPLQALAALDALKKMLPAQEK